MKLIPGKYILTTAISLYLLFSLALKPADALGEASLSLGFAPTAMYLTLEPGETYEDDITFWNLSPSTLKYRVQVKGFKQIEDVPGTSRIHTDFEESNDPYSASKWVEVEATDVELHPNEYFKLPFKITVPKDVAIGEFHTLIFLQSIPNQNPLQGSSTLADLGSGPAILINTGDNISESASLEYFKTEKKFYEYPPVTYLTRYLNNGNTHITPAGDIVIENFLGQEIDRITFNPNRQSLLRANSAVYTNDWENPPIFFKNGKIAIGPIKAKLITTYRANFPGFSPLSATTTFWILPWKIILGVILAISFIIYLISRNKAEKKNAKKAIQTSAPYINNPSTNSNEYREYP